MIGLALDGHHPDAKKFQAWSMGYFKKNYFPAWQRTGGGWQGGGQAYYRYAGDPMVLALACWASATDEDIFTQIKELHGNWLEEHMYFLMYQMLPDRTKVDSTGFQYNPSSLICSDQTLMLIARAYENPDGYAFLRWMGKEPKDNWLLYDGRTDAKKPSFPHALPLTRLWGRDGFGYLQMRSGWDQDATVIEFKCGDYFWSHNFLNQNAFYLFKKGRLAIQSGFYDQWGGNHFSHYYSKSISSNTMLIFQPGEFTYCPDERTTDRDQQGFLEEHGGQREVKWGAESCFTFKEFTSRQAPATSGTSYGRALETGCITAYEVAPDYSYSYVCGDATDAYSSPRYAYELKGRQNKPKVSLVTRSLAFLDKEVLVILDRVGALDASYRKAWLLHSSGKPQVSGQIIRTEAPGHIEDFDGDTVVINYASRRLAAPWKDGRLFVKTLLPQAHYIRRIGGEGYEFWSGGKNRGLHHQPASYCVQELGNWRIEVSPAEPSCFDVFLHVLYPCDMNTASMPESNLITAQGDKMVGVSVDGWVVMFGKTGEVEGEIRYPPPGGKTDHLVVDLEPGRRYQLSGIAGAKKIMTASTEGTLRFASLAKGTVSITPAD